MPTRTFIAVSEFEKRILSQIEVSADYFADTWANGNRTFVLENLEETARIYGPLVSIALAVSIARKLETLDSVVIGKGPLEFWSAVRRNGTETAQDYLSDHETAESKKSHISTEPDPLDYQL